MLSDVAESALHLTSKLRRLRPRRPPALRLLVHKPTFACMANCEGCASRQELHKLGRKHRHMRLEEYLELYRQAAKLGVRELHLSGGEATIYKQLPELIAEGKRHGWFVLLNTNGYLLPKRALVDALLDAGLDGVMLSLYSHRPEVHDAIRNTPGLWKRAVDGFENLIEARAAKNPNFIVVTQTIMSRDNLFDLDDLLAMNLALGSDLQVFSYMEGDYEGKLTPSVEMLERFRAETIPAMQDIAASAIGNPLTRRVARWSLGKLFDPERTSLENYARGVYNPTESDWRGCDIPDRFALALPDGAIHPCNVVEYTHEPVVGNFRDGGDLSVIWGSEVWKQFRSERHEWCVRCPMNHHQWVPLNVTLSKTARYLRTKIPAMERFA